LLLGRRYLLIPPVVTVTTVKRSTPVRTYCGEIPEGKFAI